MIDRLIDFSARHRFLVVALAMAGALLGWRAMLRVPLDALPEMSEKQVIIHSQWNRSPDLVDAQVTYPIVTALLNTPGVKSVRGISDFGASYVYVIFEDNVDLYWARSRTLEYLSSVLPRLPEGVKTTIGPDATSLGWVFQYVLVDRSGKHSLADLRSYQDWYLDYYLSSVPGVAEVTTVGGFVREYQVNVDPNRLRAYGIPVQRVAEAVKSGNREVGGRVVESGGAEYIVRGLGYARNSEDLGEVLLGNAADGTPIRVRDVASVRVGSAFRRGAAELDGTGEVVSGIVVMRQGENALAVIKRVKAKLKQIEPSLPAGVQVVLVYDRSELIERSISNLQITILEVIVTVSIVILLFLWHVPSAAVPLITIPVCVLTVFVPFQPLGLTANIMSLAGIAIAVGAMVDAAIVVVEQTHKRLDEWNRAGRPGEPSVVILRAIKQVARPSFYALLVIAISFLPVLTLQAEEGRLFRPLAYTKSLAMLIAAVLAITLDPALRLLFTRVVPYRFRPAWLCRPTNAVLVGEIHPEEANRLSRWIIRAYEPVVDWSLRHRSVVFVSVLVLIAVTVPMYWQLGTEFMPPLDEGSILYMPTTMPGISMSEAQRILQITDRRLKEFPEVRTVLGKVGRSESATDPAPISMLETVIILQPEDSWRPVSTWYSSWAPGWLKSVLRHVTPDHISREELVRGMDEAVKLPGVSNSWSMPIRGRMDMLSTGIRSPIGLKVSGANFEEIERIGSEVAAILPSVNGTRSVFAERLGHGKYLDVRWDRVALARAGISIDEAQAAVQYAIGGDDVTVLVDGRERYPVSVRYLADYRTDPEALKNVLVQGDRGTEPVPLSEVAELRTTTGPAMLRNEDGLLTGYVYVDVSGRDPSSYVEEGNDLIRSRLKLPEGYTVTWSGQYESIARMKHRLQQVVPLTLLLIIILLYLNTRSLAKTMIVLLAVPFSAVGAIWMLYALGYHVSIAVWVGLIALMGVDAETGVFMLLYLDHAYDAAKQQNRMRGLNDLRLAVLEGAARRVRPKFMTVATMFVGLLPMMWSTGTGSDVMKRIAAPMVGGVFTSFALELLVYPAIYYYWKSRGMANPPLSSEVETPGHEVVSTG